jgi:hypothetical protein
VRTCEECGQSFARETELVHHDCPVRFADHMNRASERLAEEGDHGRKELDGSRYWCRRCGKGYEKRQSLSRRGYCPGSCGLEAQLEWNIAIHNVAQQR